MKINIIGPSYPFKGGISHYTTLLYKNLKEKHQTKFYSFKRQYPKFLYPGKTDKDLSNISLSDDDIQPLLDSINPFSWINVAIKTIKDKPDILIFPWWVIFWVPQFLTIIFIVKVFSKVKIMFICHNVIEHEASSLKRMLSRLVLSRGNYFIVHSTQEEKKLIDLIGERNITETLLPTYKVFNTSEISTSEARKQLNIKDENVILFFGFVREYKGLDYLLQALPKVKDQLPIKLIIAGEFWNNKKIYTDLINQLSLENSISIYDNYIPNEDIPLYFNAADLVILPYVSVTGSALVQLAYGFNKPVVVSDIGALSQVVLHNKTGFLVEPKKPTQIAKAIISYFTTTNKEKMKENIIIENKRFSWDVLINKIEFIHSKH